MIAITIIQKQKLRLKKYKKEVLKMKMYFIEQYDENVKKWENSFAYDPDGEFTKEEAEETIKALREIDFANNENYVYRIVAAR